MCLCHVCVCVSRGGGWREGGCRNRAMVLQEPGGGVAEPDMAALGLSHGGVTGVTGTAWWCCRTKT